MRLIYIITVSLLVSVCASAAPMAHVSAVKDGRTIILDGGAELRLAGIEITNEAGARDLLRWTVVASWVMVERDANGAARIYRSPDAMFINRELVLRGYARATEPGIEPDDRIPATYLGLVNPGPRSERERTASAAAPRTRSDKSARSPARRASAPPRRPAAPRRR